MSSWQYSKALSTEKENCDVDQWSTSTEVTFFEGTYVGKVKNYTCCYGDNVLKGSLLVCSGRESTP